MADLFQISGEDVRVLRPVSFRDTHVEEDLQRWADANPHLLNEGAPMLSLGTEIVTKLGFSIDNLFVDGNGCLVVAELKRGKSPKDVIAQIVNYAAYVSKLDWGEVEDIARKYRGIDLVSAYRECFGWPLAKPDEVEFRLLIVAESYEPSVTDAALFLINRDTPLALLQFTYFEVGDSRLFEVRTVLGEIPDRHDGPSDTGTVTLDEGRVNWLLSSVAQQLPDIARRLGSSLRHVVNKQTLPIVSERWPTTRDQCQLVLTVWSGKLSLGLKFRQEDLSGLRKLVEDRRDDWREAFPADFTSPPYKTVYTSLAYEVPMPDMGDKRALAEVIERTERMAGAMLPLLEEYFESRDTSDT